MRAIVQDRYGPPSSLRLGTLPVPRPARGQVLVEVHASSVHTDVWHAVTGRPALLRLMGSGLRRPRHQVPGIDVAGVVAELGEGTDRFQVGDAVVGATVTQNQWRNGGALAEYVAVDESLLEPKPERLTFGQAATLPSCGVIAVQIVRDEGEVRAGQHVLVNGAGGAVGTFAVQLARAAGAHVTAVDRAAKADLLLAIGAEDFVDFESTDVLASAARYDVILDIASTRPFSDWRRLLKPDGTYVVVGHDHFGSGRGAVLGSVPHVLGLSVRGLVDPQLAGFRAARGGATRLRHLLDLVEEGSVDPVVARIFPLEQAAEALEYLTTEQATGRVVVEVLPGSA
jgi:NADPH:quinone reductase-like Zn-dependent oxidoreductase